MILSPAASFWIPEDLSQCLGAFFYLEDVQPLKNSIISYKKFTSQRHFRGSYLHTFQEIFYTHKTLMHKNTKGLGQFVERWIQTINSMYARLDIMKIFYQTPTP